VEDLSIYIHVPFCRKKCPYCHFYSIASSKTLEDAFFQALLEEISLRKTLFQNRNIVSIYFGGGTPFLLGAKRVAAILEKFPILGKCEITLEANPETTTLPLLREYKEIGVNRLSFGVQSFNDEELKILGRSHTSKEVYRAIDDAISVDFSNISIDLMYELPNQTLSLWKYSLQEACSLPIQHVSLYNLMLEPNSAWYRKKESIQQPSEELALKMYRTAVEEMRSSGFMQYEISAFAHSGYTSKHNSGYWKGREFLGFGPSAFSFFEKKRFSNAAHLKKYCDALKEGTLPVDFVDHVLSRLREMVAVGLRMNEGVDLSYLESLWGSADSELKETLQKLIELGLLATCGKYLSLTDQGRVLYDGVASEII